MRKINFLLCAVGFLISCDGYKNKDVTFSPTCSYYQYDSFLTTEVGIEQLEADDETTILSEDQIAPDQIYVTISFCGYEDQDNDIVEPTFNAEASA
jgi:hypothetical protein